VRKSKGSTKPGGEVKANGVSVVSFIVDGGQPLICYVIPTRSLESVWMDASYGYNRVDPM